jgi:hypothetical protein
MKRTCPLALLFVVSAILKPHGEGSTRKPEIWQEIEIFTLSPHLYPTQRDRMAEIWKEYISGETQQLLDKLPAGGGDVMAAEFPEKEWEGINQNPLTREQAILRFLGKINYIASHGEKLAFKKWRLKLIPFIRARR